MRSSANFLSTCLRLSHTQYIQAPLCNLSYYTSTLVCNFPTLIFIFLSYRYIVLHMHSCENSFSDVNFPSYTVSLHSTKHVQCSTGTLMQSFLLYKYSCVQFYYTCIHFLSYRYIVLHMHSCENFFLNVNFLSYTVLYMPSCAHPSLNLYEPLSYTVLATHSCVNHWYLLIL
jgi:hypothetical protein